MKEQQLEIIRKIRQQQFTQVDGGTLTPPGTPAAQRHEIRIPTSYGEARTHVYVPLHAAKPAPVFINLHGGGFVLGTPEMDDPWCAYVADLSGCMVFNVEYVLAPEYPFPAAVYQCYEVAQWIMQHAPLNGTETAPDSQLVDTAPEAICQLPYVCLICKKAASCRSPIRFSTIHHLIWIPIRQTSLLLRKQFR